MSQPHLPSALKSPDTGSCAAWLRRLLGRLRKWLLTPPPANAFALTNIRKAAQILHSCEWEDRAEPGEEEHGKNPAKRYCKVCGREQWAFYHRFGNTCMTWEDAPKLAMSHAPEARSRRRNKTFYGY